ncbi:MAG: hypothetical protein FPO08_04575 [Geobacter sp.]|nr:MAG: hypothetical protein FPO08_04575 [Geobacter sp.]
MSIEVKEALEAVLNNNSRAFIYYGAPGCGKSGGITEGIISVQASCQQDQFSKLVTDFKVIPADPSGSLHTQFKVKP